MKKLNVLITVLFVVGIFASCDKNSDLFVATPEIGDNNNIELNQFQKDVTIYSTEGSSAVMRISANNEALLTNYSADNFKLVEINNGENIEDALVRNELMDLSQEDPKNEDLDIEAGENVKSELSFELGAIVNPKANVRYAVSFFHPESLTKKPWVYTTHTGVANQDTKVSITRHSFWRRVYYGVSYKLTSSSSWSTIISTYAKLGNNQTYSVTKDPSYQLEAYIKTKSNSAYTVSFDN